ncbi:MAG: family 10 glycosylhydrolase [Phycisphaerae bacterium]|jgi:uncharacterized lipoprotein YddW (UPF0748 family)
MHPRRGQHRRFTAVLALLAASAGCHAPIHRGPTGRERLQPPVRAVWVTRTQYRSPADVARVMENCRQAGFNHVVFQVRGNGTVFYPSRLEPWAEQFDFQSPGFDPLAVACQEAHARGLLLHAWVNVMPAWRGTRPPSHPDQLYNKRPEWFWYDQHGRRQALSSFYVSLNPCLPEVRAYLVEVFRELITGHDVDGLHMDYIRFPNEPPAIPEGSGLDYPRDAKTLALYRAATGKAPDDDPAEWNRWRTQQVTELVRAIRAMTRRVRPTLMLTASLGTNPAGSLRHFRDDLAWAREGLLDGAFPMNYKPDREQFVEGLRCWLPLRDRVQVIPGLWFAPRLPTQEGIEVVRQQIQAAVESTGNFCLFSYSSLFGGDDEGGLTASPAATRPAGSRRGAGRDPRPQRRADLIPFIRSLAAAEFILEARYVNNRLSKYVYR